MRKTIKEETNYGKAAMWVGICGLVGFGAWWLSFGGGRRKASNLLDRISRGHPIDSTREWISKHYTAAKDAIFDDAEQLSDRAARVANSVRRSSSAAADKVEQKAHRMSEHIKDAERESELVTA